MRAFVTAASLLICVSLAFPAVITDGTISATPDASKITVRWISSDETGVVAYEIARSAGYSGAFVPLVSLPARGNGTAYEYVDNTVFKTNDSFYRYSITPKNKAGEKIGDAYYVSTPLPNVSGVRRTWGSIKAMFR